MSKPFQSEVHCEFALEQLKTDSDFAMFLAEQVKLGLDGNQDALDCVDSYYEPTDSEMQNFGIPSSKLDVMRKCTESGFLVLITAREALEASESN